MGNLSLLSSMFSTDQFWKEKSDRFSTNSLQSFQIKSSNLVLVAFSLYIKRWYLSCRNRLFFRLWSFKRALNITRWSPGSVNSSWRESGLKHAQLIMSRDGKKKDESNFKNIFISLLLKIRQSATFFMSLGSLYPQVAPPPPPPPLKARDCGLVFNLYLGRFKSFCITCFYRKELVLVNIFD